VSESGRLLPHGVCRIKFEVVVDLDVGQGGVGDLSSGAFAGGSRGSSFPFPLV
jgi:hypothetical protein